jgi:carboxyl-terminal processing protease
MLNAARWTVLGLLAASILVLAFAIGYVLADDGGDSSSGNVNASGDAKDLEGEDVDFDVLNQIIKLLDDRYVDQDRLDNRALYEAAINGMLQTLSDSGTFYVDPVTVATGHGPSGSFEGIGATVSTQNGEIVIVAPIEDTPAARAGIQPGDAILSVNGESTQGWTQEKAAIMIRGPKGTTVTLVVRHPDGTEETLEIERAEIEVQSVTTQPPGGTLQDGAGTQIDDVAYIHIREFTRPTIDQFRDALQEAVDSGKRGLILDLRNNPGGLLRTTVDVADEFLDDGVILSEVEGGSDEEQHIRATKGGIATEIPIVVLINRFSASGSEVLAAALRENGRATVVGEKSFGKGTVNISNDLEDGGQVYISIAKWLTPNGLQIDGVGVRPDINVELSDEDIDQRRDVQLFKALDVLRGTDTTPVTALPPQSTPAATATATGG